MGYATTNIILFGLVLTMEKAKRIFEKHFNEEEFKYDKKDTLTDEVAYVHRITGPVYRERNIPEMVADGSDSRIDNMCFSEDYDRHIIGIHLASRGYACDDKLEDYMKEPSEKAISNFNKYILPILEEEGITEKPTILLATQVW